MGCSSANTSDISRPNHRIIKIKDNQNDNKNKNNQNFEGIINDKENGNNFMVDKPHDYSKNINNSQNKINIKKDTFNKEDEYDKKIQLLKERCQSNLDKLKIKYEEKIVQIKEKYEKSKLKLEEDYKNKKIEFKKDYENQKNNLPDKNKLKEEEKQYLEEELNKNKSNLIEYNKNIDSIYHSNIKEIDKKFEEAKKLKFNGYINKKKQIINKYTLLLKKARELHYSSEKMNDIREELHKEMEDLENDYKDILNDLNMNYHYDKQGVKDNYD